MTKEQMIKALLDIDRAEEFLMRPLDDWEEDYISKKGYMAFICDKLKMDQSDMYTMYAIRRAVSDYCTKAITSDSPKLRLGANFMEENPDETPESDEETSGCILNIVERESQKRAIDTLQTIVNCLQQCYDDGCCTHINKFIPQEAGVCGAVFDDSQFKDMVNVESAVDDCEEKNAEENTSDTLFPESFRPWLKYISGDEVTKIIKTYDEVYPDTAQEFFTEKVMNAIKIAVYSKLEQEIIRTGGGVIENDEIRNEVYKDLVSNKYLGKNVYKEGEEIKISSVPEGVNYH